VRPNFIVETVIRVGTSLLQYPASPDFVSCCLYVCLLHVMVMCAIIVYEIPIRLPIGIALWKYPGDIFDRTMRRFCASTCVNRAWICMALQNSGRAPGGFCMRPRGAGWKHRRDRWQELPLVVSETVLDAVAAKETVKR